MTTRSKQLEEMKVSIGRTAAAARVARNWSQEYVGQKLEVDSETISRLERGQSVRLERLLDLAILYEMPVSSFFKGAPGPRPSTDDELAMAISILDDINKDWVLQMVRAVVDKMER